MKLKKTITSKPFIAGTLAVLCVGILATCLLLQKNDQTEFTPEPTSSAAPVESWSEHESAAADKETGTSTGTDIAAKEEYPKVTESSEAQTVIDFTDPEPSKPEAPPVPEGKTEVPEPQSSHPVKKDPTVTPSKQDTIPPKPPQTNQSTEAESENQESPNSTAPDDGHKSGQVYDPVFGWITPGAPQGNPVDAGGDPNKEIGNMN